MRPPGEQLDYRMAFYLELASVLLRQIYVTLVVFARKSMQ
jgi:hypothetical protein